MQENESIMFLLRTENTATRDNCSASLDKPRDPNSYPRGEIFNLHLTIITDSYNPLQELCLK